MKSSHSEPPNELPRLTRVRMSALGEARCPNLAGKEGTVVGSGRYPSTVRVMFDDFSWPTSLHSTYIETVAKQKGSPPDRPADNCSMKEPGHEA